MPVKFFGQFLLEQGAIDRDALLEGIRLQEQIGIPLCALALRNGCFSNDQIHALDTRHAGSPKKFVELALREGMLTFEQLETLSRAQPQKWLFLGEALAEGGHLKLAQLSELFEQYARTRAPAAGPQPAPRAAIPHHDVVTTFTRITGDLLLHYAKQLARVRSVERAHVRTHDITYLFSQKVTGDRRFWYALILSEPLTVSIAAAMLEEPRETVDADALDAVTEFVNVVIGNGCTELNMKDYKVSAQPPQAVMTERIDELVPADVVTVNMESGSGEFQIAFSFAENEAKLPGAPVQE